MRVLLLTPLFYGIDERIKAALKNLDYDVTWIENRTLPLDYHSPDSKLRFLRKIYFKIFSPRERYLRKEFRKLKDRHFDILFAINGGIVCEFLFKSLKQYNSDLYSIVYFWDSFSKFDWSRELKYFNKAFSFDSGDSHRYKIEYKPNFYLKPEFLPGTELKYDLFFIGKFNPSRLSILDKLLEISEIQSITTYFRLYPAFKIFLHNAVVYRFIKIMNFKSHWFNDYIINYEAVEGLLKKKFMIAEFLDYNEVQSDFLSSNVILDLPYNGQKGYTHRIIEALAYGKKILTTNSNILKEEFYDPDQIHLLKENEPESDLSWIREQVRFPVRDYCRNLELSIWLKSIVNAEPA